ncbi:MAG: hypothetical protein JSR39_07960 [Verrucomicrobia bacterium]|nr:hypothetical protein [Verrucomicrobiota bacterium]
MSFTITLATHEDRQRQLRLLSQWGAGENQSPIPSEALSEMDIVNIQLFTRTVQWCLRQDDADSRVALETICEQIIDCPNVLANVQYFLPLISEYLHVQDRSTNAREHLINLTERSLEVLSKLN